MTKILFKLIEDGKFPIKGSKHAACYDAYARYVKPIPNDLFKIEVGLGFATEIPVGWKGHIVARSNITKYNWVLNNCLGVIDCDYRNEWKAIFTVMENDTFPSIFPYSKGERVVQIYFEPVHEVEMEVVDALSETTRGMGGFGSSGLK